MPLTAPAFPAVTNGASSYNADNQMLSSPGRSFSYDNNGNMLTATGTPALGFTYNQLNQLTRYTNAGAAMDFTYDALGNRIKKVSAGVTTKYIGGLVETDSAGTITAYYVYGLGLISKIEGSSAYYYQYDGLGSTIAITDKTGVVKNKYAYDDYGQIATNSTETIANSFKYVGQFGVETDAADLLFTQARYYIPSSGRFINKDPSGLTNGLNLYQYALSNPINAIDFDGEKAQWHFDFSRAGERLIHFGKYRFNRFGQLVRHSGEVLGEAGGKAKKALEYLIKVKPDFFGKPILFPILFLPTLCQNPIYHNLPECKKAGCDIL